VDTDGSMNYHDFFPDFKFYQSVTSQSSQQNKLLSDFVYSYIQKIGKIHLQHSEEKNYSPIVTPLGSPFT
jgi:hypothetical protein